MRLDAVRKLLQKVEVGHTAAGGRALVRREDEILSICLPLASHQRVRRAIISQCGCRIVASRW
jgi:hypothetical protein